MWQTIGQPEVLTLLERSFNTNNLAHAYLFVGPPHVGKTTLALDLARIVNCQGEQPPCSKCQACRRIIEGKHADITVIGLNSTTSSKEIKSRTEIGIEDIRELQQSASLLPYEGKHKVFIIDGAEHLSSEAANCLLKTLEEPPPTVLIILLTAEELRLLPTVVSRCQRVKLKPMSNKEVENVLIERYRIDEDRARPLARLSQGCLGWALTASTNNDYLTQQAQKLSELYSLLNARWEERFSYAAQVGNNRKSAEELIKLWLIWWRDMMLAKCGCKDAITSVDQSSTLNQCAQALSLLEIKQFINTLQESLSQISRNANLRLVFEILMLDMPRKEASARHTILSTPSAAQCQT